MFRTKEDFIETIKLTKKMKKDFKLFPIVLVFKPDDKKSVCTSSMFSFGIDEKFRDENKNSIKNARGYIFVDSDINPNGITSKDDIARTYVIHFKVRCSFRAYKCKNWCDDYDISSIYTWGRTMEEVFQKFESDFKTMNKSYIKEHIKK